MVSKILSLLFALTLTANATIAIVQTDAVTTGATNATTLASSSLTWGKGHYIFISVCVGSGASYWMSDNSNVSWSYITRSAASGGVTYFLIRGTVLTGFTGTVTFNASTSSAICMKTAEISSTYALVMDQQATNNVATTTTADGGTTGTTTYNNELMIAALGHRLQSSSTTGTFASLANSFLDVVSGTSTPTNTNCSTDLNTSNNDREVCLAYKIVTTTGTAHCTATVTGSNTVGGCTATFYETAPSGFFSN